MNDTLSIIVNPFQIYFHQDRGFLYALVFYCKLWRFSLGWMRTVPQWSYVYAPNRYRPGKYWDIRIGRICIAINNHFLTD